MTGKTVQTLFVLLVGLALTALTTVSLIFAEVPVYIYSNIAGLALVAISSGGMVGVLFSVAIAVFKFFANLTGSILTADLLKNIAEVLLLVLSWKMVKKDWQRVSVSVMLLTLVAKPLYFLFYFWLHRGGFVTADHLKNNILGYYAGDFVRSGMTYIVSVVVAYLIFTIYKKLVTKGVDLHA